MPNIDKLIVQGRGLAAALLRRAAAVELDWAQRRLGRFEATDSAGRKLTVALPSGQALRGGDVLVGDDGSLVVVVAAAQPVLVARPRATQGRPDDLLRAAYRLGTHRAAVALHADRLELEPDARLRALLEQMHLVVSEETVPFEPVDDGDGAAAADEHRHTHGHGHGRGHRHDHAHACGHDHTHDHTHDHAHDHTHGSHDPRRPR